jgi:serine protease AprX
MKQISMLALATMALTFQAAQAGTVLRLKAVGTKNTAALKAIAGGLEGNRLFVVQWKSQVHESEKAQLAALGLDLLNYLPDDAFLAQGDANAARKAEGFPFVQAVIPYSATFKLERGIAPASIATAGTAMVSIQLAPNADRAAVKALVMNGTDASGLVIGSVSAANLYALAARGDVLWIEKYLPLRMMDMKPSEIGQGMSPTDGPTRTGFESGVRIINVDAAYANGLHGEGQVVAVADTGLDTGDVSTLNADFQGQLKIGIAVGLGGSSWGDPEMHGTHVSGSILGNGKNSNGLIRGGAYGAQLVMMGMWSDIMNNIVPPTIDKLYQTGYDNGARIQSNSWGQPNSNGRYDNWAQLTDQWCFAHPDYLPMFAAGNDGADLNGDGVIDEGSVGSPGTAKNVLTVGASKNFLMTGGIQKAMKDLRNGTTKWAVEPIASSKLSEDPNGLAAFSSRGPTADGRIKPEIVAPGTNIVSVRDHHPKADPASMSWGIYDDNYVYMGGTSMATPVAAGGVAIVRQWLQQQTGEASPSAALLKATVANAADDLYPGQFGERRQGQEEPTVRPNNHEGWGRVDLANFTGNRQFKLVDDSTGLATGQNATQTIKHAGGALRVTMAYTDAPGVASAEKTLVNDLDLTVTDASGKVFYPNNGSGKDSTNNMEQIDIGAAPAGAYTITVTGANVPSGKNGKQPYALVISEGN